MAQAQNTSSVFPSPLYTPVDGDQNKSSFGDTQPLPHTMTDAKPLTATANKSEDPNVLSPLTDHFPARNGRDDGVTGAGQDFELNIKESHDGPLYPQPANPPSQSPRQSKRPHVWDQLKNDALGYFADRQKENARIPSRYPRKPSTESVERPEPRRAANAKPKTPKQTQVYAPRPASTRVRKSTVVSISSMLISDPVTPPEERPAKRPRRETADEPAPAIIKPAPSVIKPAAAATTKSSTTETKRTTTTRKPSMTSKVVKPKKAQGVTTKTKPESVPDSFAGEVKLFMNDRTKSLLVPSAQYGQFADAHIPETGELIGKFVANEKAGKDSLGVDMITEYTDPSRVKDIAERGAPDGLHEAEIQLAKNLSLTYDQYRCQKRRFFLGYAIYLKKRELNPEFTAFNKTKAQKMADIDVTKASFLFTNFSNWGWTDQKHFSSEHRNEVYDKCFDFMQKSKGKAAAVGSVETK